jgi:formylglycine-generating enzyme
MADRPLVPKDRQSSPTSPPQGSNYLLAIAINDYLHCSKLNNAVRDAEAFIELMTTRYHFDPKHVTFIKDTEATKRRIEQEFFRLIKAITPQDNLIVYFSGHGRHDEHFGGNWVPVDAGTTDDDWPDYLSNDTIKSYLSKIKSMHTFLIADSCFSGSLFIDKSKEKFSGDRRDTEPSRWGLTSGKKEIVSDGRPGHHSPFATALLDVLRRADQPPGVMRICDLVLEKVVANAEQTPMGSPLQVPGHQGGQMVLYFREDEEADWQAAQQANTRQAYSNFYRQYPHGQYADEALAQLESVEEKEIWEQVPKNREAALLRFMRENPTSPYLADAQRLIDQLQANVKPAPTPIAPAKPFILVPDHMVLVKGGTFQMGSNEHDREKPVHPVTLNDFLIAKHQLTFDEYTAFCKATGQKEPSDEGWGRGQRPVINVNWFDAVNYCNWRSQQEGLKEVYQVNKEQVSPNWQANGYRLPTEAEWEYAARGGQQSQSFEYAGSNNVDEVAWHRYNSGNKTQPVGQKKPNELGLYDLSGNVWEWCWDWYGDYPTNITSDPKGPADTGSVRVFRGGSWNFEPIVARVAYRSYSVPDYLFNRLGFRLARAAVAL